jgi:hypothetical protein
MAVRTVLGPVDKVARQKPPADTTTSGHGARIKALEEKVEELIIQAGEVLDEVVRATIQANRAVSKVNQLNGKYRRVHR